MWRRARGPHTHTARCDAQEGQPQDWELRKAWPWWKVKKWTLHVAHRLFKRYGDPRGLADGSPERAFADLWRKHCSAQFLQAQLDLLALVPAVRMSALVLSPAAPQSAPC